jgi:hypothetical protein
MMNRTRMRLTMLALSESRLPDPTEICRAYASSFPNAAPLTSSEAGTSDSDQLSFASQACSFTVALIRAPIAWSDLSDPCDAAWYWPEAAETLRPQRGHLLVTASSATEDAIALMLSLTRVLAAVAQCSAALGIYLGGARLVHKVADFVSEAEGASRELLPLYLWVRFSIREEPGGTLSLTTTGLADLELMELSFPHAALDGQTLMDRAFNIAHYLLDRGPVLENGHTIGISADEKFHVTHVPSPHAAGKLVYQFKLV